MPLDLVLAYLCSLDVLAVHPRDLEVRPNEGEPEEPLADDDPYLPVIEKLNKERIVAFQPGWKKRCSGTKAFQVLHEFPLGYQLVLEEILSRLVRERQGSDHSDSE